MPEIPPVLSQWTHYNNVNYVVLAIANLETMRPKEYPITVVYKNLKNNTVWSRPLSEWSRSFKRVRYEMQS